MRRWLYPAGVLLAITTGALAGLFWGPSTSLSGENVQVLWMSGVIKNNYACVGQLGLHGNYAYDLFADDAAPCYGPGIEAVHLRTIGISATTHVTLRAQAFSGEYGDGCDYNLVNTYVQPRSYYWGQYRWLHSQGAYGQWVNIWSGPYHPWSWLYLGTTIWDTDCPNWQGHHTHQDAISWYSQPNWNLGPNMVIPVWNESYYIHKWTYTEP